MSSLYEGGGGGGLSEAEAKTLIGNETAAPVFNVKKYGAKGDGTTNDTAAIQAAIDAAAAAKGTCYIPEPVGGHEGAYMFSNLLLSAYVTLRGAGMGSCVLKRIPGSTGTALKEKTAGEGNTNHANDIRVEDLFIDGNGTAGNGLELGEVEAAGLANRGTVNNVMVRYFPEGTGIRLNTNAVKIGMIWANLNKVGVVTKGAASLYAGLWAENNTERDLLVNSAHDTFLHVQIETEATENALIKIENPYVRFFGVYIALAGDVKKILNVVGASEGGNVSVFGMSIRNNGHTWEHGCYSEAKSVGTGSSVKWIPQWHYQAGIAATSVDSTTGNVYKQESGTVSLNGNQGVAGPASATAGHLAVFDGTTGGLIKDGGVVPTSGTGAMLQKPPTGGTSFVTNDLGTRAGAIVSASSGLMFLVPIDLGWEFTFDQIGCSVVEVGTGAGNVIRLGLYADDGTGTRPTGAALFDAGTVSATEGTGDKTLAMAKTFGPARVWGAYVCQGTVTTGAKVQSVSNAVCLIGAANLGSTASHVLTQSAVSGALPSIGTLSRSSQPPPLIGLRVA